MRGRLEEAEVSLLTGRRGHGQALWGGQAHRPKGGPRAVPTGAGPRNAESSRNSHFPVCAVSRGARFPSIG